MCLPCWPYAASGRLTCLQRLLCSTPDPGTLPCHLQATPGVSDDEDSAYDDTRQKFCFCFPMPQQRH